MVVNPLVFILINSDPKTDRGHKAGKTWEWKNERDQIFRDWQQLWQEFWLIFWWDVIWRGVSWLVLGFQKNYQNQCACPKEGPAYMYRATVYQLWTFPCETTCCFINYSPWLIYLSLMSFVGGTDSGGGSKTVQVDKRMFETGGKWAHTTGEEMLLQHNRQ